MLPVARRGGFDLVEQTLTEGAARSEAARCMQCSTLCDKCVEVCPNRANYAYLVSPVSLTLPQLACQNGELVVTGETQFQVKQARQIIHVDDFCNECGNCATFCVHHGKPYLEKPRLFLEESDFEQEDDNAFYVERGEREPTRVGWTIRRREGGRESRLALESDTDEMTFENDLLKMTISSPDFRVKTKQLKRGFQGEFSLVGPAEMCVILKGVIASLPFLPSDVSSQ